MPRELTGKVADVSTTVVLVDDHELIRQGLRRAFERTGDFTVVGEAGTVARSVATVAEHTPDVVIFDVRLPDGSGLDAARKVREGNPTMGIVVLTMYAGDDQLFGALEAGASAFVPKDAPAEDVDRRRPARGRVAPRLHRQRPRRRDAAPAVPDRTAAEPARARGAGLLADGLGVAAISKQLFISESTTKTHISKVYEKLGAGEPRPGADDGHAAGPDRQSCGPAPLSVRFTLV